MTHSKRSHKSKAPHHRKDAYRQTAAQMRAKARPRRILVTDEDRKRWTNWSDTQIRAAIRVGWALQDQEAVQGLAATEVKRLGLDKRELSERELMQAWDDAGAYGSGNMTLGQRLQAFLKHLGAGHQPGAPKRFRIRQATLEKFVELDHLEDGPALAAILPDLMRDRPDKVRDAMLERLEQRLREWMTQLKPIPASIGEMTPNQFRAVVRALFPEVTP